MIRTMFNNPELGSLEIDGIIKVLLVEDNPTDALLIRNMLEDLPNQRAEVTHVETLSEGIKALADEDFSLVLLDLGLPDAAGLQTFDNLSSRFPNIPVVVLTGLDDSAVALDAVKSGAKDYLVKGETDSKPLVRSVRHALVRHNMEKAIEEQVLQLNKNRQQLSAIVEASTDGIVVVDQFGITHFVNPSAAEFFKESETDLSGRKFNYPLPEKGPGEIRVVCPGGLIKEAEIRSIPFEWEGSPAHLVMIRDITGRKKLEVELRQNQKMKAIGVLAAGIAHEINTPAQFVWDNLSFIEQTVGDLLALVDETNSVLENQRAAGECGKEFSQIKQHIADMDLPELLEEIPDAVQDARQGIKRIAEIVQAVKALSHPGLREKEPVDVNAAIADSITLSRSEWKYAADLVTELQSDLPKVPAVSSDLKQVFINLIINAADAIKTQVGKNPSDKGTIIVRSRLENASAVVEIEDTGVGIAVDIHDRVFEPFFSTKDVGKGLGQGLSVCHSVIVDKLGGSISFDSDKGRGTKFTIKLPLE